MHRAWSGRSAELIWSLLIIVACALASGMYQHYFYPWPRNEDLQLLDLLRGWSDHSLGVTDILRTANVQHPIGIQALVQLTVLLIAGVDYRHVLWFNHLVLCLSALLVFVLARRTLPRAAAGLIGFLSVGILFHPVQTNNLLWPYQTGWFLIDFALLANILLIECLQWRALPGLALTCALASLASRHGEFTWFAAAAHLLLMGGRANLLAALTMPVGFGIALAAAPAAEAHLPPIGEYPSLVRYALALVGEVFGFRHPSVAIGFGAFLLCFCVPIARLPALRSWGRPRDALKRVSAVLLFAGALDLAAFALGRASLGLPWAFDRFHPATMMVPPLLAILFWWGEAAAQRPWPARILLWVPILAVSVSIGTALAFYRERGREDYRQRALAAFLVCGETRDRLTLNSIHGLPPTEQIVERNLPALRRFCPGMPVPRQVVLAYERPPEVFERLAQRTPEWAAALHALWDVYLVRFDLQRAFPIGDPELARHLLVWAAHDAEAGGHFEPDALGAHAAIYPEIAASWRLEGERQ